MTSKDDENLHELNFLDFDRWDEVSCQILNLLKSRNYKIFCSFVFKRSTGAAILGYGAAKS